jgi:glycogen operon protein
VSYNDKHNEANGEGNKDGESHNRSWNGGVEGPTDDPAINELRLRQQRNLLTTLLLSQGVPMIAHGDELGRTQNGNNNVYCQDNELSWVDWNLTADQQSLMRFSQRLVRLRSEHPCSGAAASSPGRQTMAARASLATSRGSRQPASTWARSTGPTATPRH